MKLDRFIQELVLGDQHRGGIRCLRLFTVEATAFDRLQREVEVLQRRFQPSTVQHAGHVTHWTDVRGQVTQYSLLNSSGRTADFSDDHNLSCQAKRFVDTASFPTIGQLVGDWPHLVNCRVNVLDVGAAISPHEEHVPFRTHAGTVGARLRFHLPIATNEGAELNLDGSVFHLQAGVVHLVNQGCVHGARNGGGSRRVHLVWDALLTLDLYRFLFDPARMPGYFERIVDLRAEPVRSEPLAPHRRMPPAVSASEAAGLAVCEPQ